MFQTAKSDLVNFPLDNVLLANSRGIAAKAGSNIVPGEPIYPGKIWITDGPPKDEFMPFQLSEIYPSLPATIQLIQQLGERRTGISDIQLGNMQNLPGRTPATTMLSLLQEGTRRPDLTLKDMRYEGLSQVGLRLLQLCQQFISSPVDVGGQRLLQLAVQALGEQAGQAAGQKLTMPLEPAELGLGVHITATSQSANKEVSRQSHLALLELAGQLYPQFIQLMGTAQQLQGTAAGQVATQAASGLQELFRRILEDYDIRNPEKVLPLGDQPAQTMTAHPAGQPQGFPGPAPAGPGPPAAVGIAPLAPIPALAPLPATP